MPGWCEKIVRAVQGDETDWSIIVDADPCTLPDHLTGQTVLQMGSGLALPPEPVFNHAGISVTLSFGRAPFDCWIPWEAIMAVVTAQTAIVFHPGPAASKPVHPSVGRKPTLKVVK